jgi:hypothetical protein
MLFTWYEIIYLKTIIVDQNDLHSIMFVYIFCSNVRTLKDARLRASAMGLLIRYLCVRLGHAKRKQPPTWPPKQTTKVFDSVRPASVSFQTPPCFKNNTLPLIFNISKKRKCMVRKASKNEFAGLKLYLLGFGNHGDAEALSLLFDEFRIFNP